MARLPRGAGVVFRTFGRAEVVARGPALRRTARERGLVFLVGADARLAWALDADGLHLPERLVPARIDRRAWPRGFLITAAGHDLRAVLRAGRAGADAVVVSPIFASRSPSAGRALGATKLAAIARLASLPVYALGGIDARTATRVRTLGVAGLAAIEGLYPSDDPRT